ncbi:uncharacterized protein LODBEIA_P33270 [Lodderomyces beijingensis]|uniref:FF domain-containing protein n=1 Tax=Lodderomyces beijingensis TaxID=1775926 RepID=A0ABP0ZLR2_9ASCO
MAIPMHPQFIYKIPQNESWYIVITNTSHHFYFNARDKLSFWQLSDVKQHYQGDVDIVELMQDVEFDQLAVLFASARGCDVKRSSRRGETDGVKRVGGDELGAGTLKRAKVEAKDAEGSSGNGNVDASTEAGKSDDWGKETKDDERHRASGDASASKVSLLAGYSSSSDEEEEEEEEENVATAEPDDKPQDYENSKSKLIDVLNSLSGQISEYDAWDLVQNKLSDQLHHVNALLSDHNQQKIFTEWINDRKTVEVLNEIYPTEKIKLLSLLQSHKDEVRNSYYPNFYNYHYLQLNTIQLSTSEKETTFRKYKNFVNEFASFEKKFKQSNKNAVGNVKVMKVDEFLHTALKLKLKHEHDFTQMDNLSDFDNWIRLLNYYDVDLDIAEDETNFLLGDEKRLKCYMDAVNKLTVIK